MTYKELIDLGFIHIEDHCEQWKNQYGYEYFRVEFWIEKRLNFDWDVQSQKVTMYSYEKDGHSIKEKWDVPDLETLKNLIRVLSKGKPSKNYEKD